MAMDKTQTLNSSKNKAVSVGTGSARPFLVRKRNSNQVLRCPDLATLRQWIAERRLTREDEVSRSGQKWRKMGGIVEFESLFYGVDQERLSKRQAEKPSAAGPDPKNGVSATASTGASAKAGSPDRPEARPEARLEARPETKAEAKLPVKPEAKPEAAAEKPAIGTLKVTPPGLDQVSGNLSLMRLARTGSGKAKPAGTPPGLGASAQAAERKERGPGAAPEAKAEMPVAVKKEPEAATAKKPADRPVSAARPVALVKNVPDLVEDEDATKKITSSDETQRFDRDSKATSKAKPADPIEEAIRKSDPVPQSLKDAREVTKKIETTEPDEYEQIERQAARRRNGILFLVAGGAALGLYYLLASDQPIQPHQPQPGIEQKPTEPVNAKPATDKPTPPVSGPVVEPLTPPTSPTSPTKPPVSAEAKPTLEKTIPVGPAPGPSPAAKPPVAVSPPPTPGPAPNANVGAAKPAPAVAPAPVAAVKPVAPVAPAAPAAKITSDEVRRIIEQDIPKTFDGQIELANRFFERGKYDQALAVYQLMLTYAPNVPAIHKALGDISFERNQPDEAIAHYNDALQIRPSYSAAEFGIGKTYHRLKNDKDRAIQHYGKYLEMNPKGAAAPASRDAILKLGGTPPPLPGAAPAAPAPAPATAPEIVQ